MKAIRSTSLLARLRAWLAPSDTPRNADLIFVLAGRVHRKEYALDLFRRGLAPGILFSVGRYEIRRFSKMPLPVSLDLLKMAEDVPPPERHYFVFFQGQEARVEHVPPKYFGTLMEIEALAGWLTRNPGMHSVLVISSDTHLRRIRMCCRSLLNAKTELTFLDAPLPLAVQPLSATAGAHLEQPPQQADASAASLKDDLLEVLKLAIYWVLLKAR